MNIAQFGLTVSILTIRMISFLVNILDASRIEKAPGGLPAGAVFIREARLVIATTCCRKPLFHAEMHRAAAATGADVLLMRHGLEVEETAVTTFDVLIHVNGHPCLVTDLVLYDCPVDGHWLVPSGNGAHIALESDGLRLADEAPFITWSQRCDAVCRAAKELKRAARPGARPPVRRIGRR